MLAFMIFSLLASAAIALGVLLLERAAHMRKLPTRWLWVSAMSAMVVVTALPFTRASVAPVARSTASPAVTTETPLPSAASVASSAVAPVRQTRKPVPAILHADVVRQSDPSTDVLLLALWALLSVLCLAVLVGSAWRIARMRREWRPAVVAGVPVLVSHDTGPAIVGLVHHGVVIPGWVESLSLPEQRLVLTHEREHVRAGDPLLLWGATLVAVLAPWNLAMWFALRHVKHAIEIDCDARVLRRQPDTHAYCSLLMDVGERTLAGVAPIAALAEPSTLLERRVDAMTSRSRGSWRPLAIGIAGIVLVAAGCVAPRTQVAPQIRALTLVRELTDLLGTDSIARSLPSVDRMKLVAKLERNAGGGVPLPGESLSAPGVYRRTSAEWERMLDPQPDTALRTFYPGLYARRDTAQQLVVLTYDAQARLKRHETRPMPDLQTIMKPNSGLKALLVLDRFAAEPIQWAAHRERPSLHATLLLQAERGDTTPSARRTRSFGGNASSPVAPALQFSRRVDSLARVDFPVAFEPRENAFVVAVLFDAQGNVVRKNASPFPVSAVFDTIPGTSELGMRDSRYILGLMKMASAQFAGAGATSNSNAPHAAFIWGYVHE